MIYKCRISCPQWKLEKQIFGPYSSIINCIEKNDFLKDVELIGTAETKTMKDMSGPPGAIGTKLIWYFKSPFDPSVSGYIEIWDDIWDYLNFESGGSYYQQFNINNKYGR